MIIPQVANNKLDIKRLKNIHIRVNNILECMRKYHAHTQTNIYTDTHRNTYTHKHTCTQTEP